MGYDKVDPVLCDASSEFPAGCYIEHTPKGLAYGCAYKDFLADLKLKPGEDAEVLNKEDGKLLFEFCVGDKCNKNQDRLVATTVNTTIEDATTSPDHTDAPHGQKLMTASSHQHESKVEFFLLVAYLTFYFRF